MPPYGFFGGTFSPFDNEEFSERYPDHGEYVDRVTRAADRLLTEGYIVRADRDAYVSAAAENLRGVAAVVDAVAAASGTVVDAFGSSGGARQRDARVAAGQHPSVEFDATAIVAGSLRLASAHVSRRSGAGPVDLLTS